MKQTDILQHYHAFYIEILHLKAILDMKSSSQLGSEAHHLSNVVDLGDLCAQKWNGPSLGSECQSHCTKRSTHHHLRELIPAHLDCTLKRVTRETESLNNILSISADMEISEREV